MTKNLLPHIWRTQQPGIPGVDGFKLCYGSWHFLNQAFSCFINGENYACISCLTASIELWLKRELKSKKELFKLIDSAEKSELITKEEKVMLHGLRKIRNSYLHFDLDKLPKFKKKSKTLKLNKQTMFLSPRERQPFIDLDGEDVCIYPDASFFDSNPLAILPVHSYLYLNSLTEFFKKRYPRKEDGRVDSYYIFKLLEIDGLDESKIIFKLPKTRKYKSKIDKLFSFLGKNRE